jgi:hypothetical protein
MSKVALSGPLVSTFILGTMALTRLAEDLFDDGVSETEWRRMRAGPQQASSAGRVLNDESSTTRTPFGQGDQGSTGSGEASIVGSKYSSVQTIF